MPDLRGFLRRIGNSSRPFAIATVLIAIFATAPVAWVLLNAVAAETLEHAADSTPTIPLASAIDAASLPTMAGAVPIVAATTDTDAVADTAEMRIDVVAAAGDFDAGDVEGDALIIPSPRPAEADMIAGSLPESKPNLDSPASMQLALLHANGAAPLDKFVAITALVPSSDIKPDHVPAGAYSINLGTMSLEDDGTDAGSLNAYGLTKEEIRQIVEVKPGDTLIELLVDAGATQTDAYAAITALEPAFSPRELKPGQSIELTFATAQPDSMIEVADFQLVGLQITPNAERDVQVNRSFDGLFTVMEIEHPLQRTAVRGGGTIESSLYQAAVDAGVSLTALTEMIRAFSFDVDFQREIQPGDSFEIVYEHFIDENGEPVKTGDVVYASLTLSDDTLELYRFTPSSGVWDFFNSNGQSVRKALMRTPIDGAQLTSGFGMRTHPTLGYTKMHRGVDFGAPTGTPIYAAGDGVIEKIGPFSSYGNYIRIRHNSEYSTAYAHMSGFAKGLGQGDRVHQGDVIGYVGTTGRSTGPHLHYEVLINGEQVNPLNIKLPAGEKLAGADLEDFFLARDDIVALRDTLRRGELMLARSQGRCYPGANEDGC